ncbi:MAG: hypothetical protein R6V11_11060, partial [Ectothiorhodospiraceae bacterium]
EEAIANHVVVMGKRQQDALQDPDLNGEYEQLIVEEYTRTIDALVNAQHALCDARWAIMEHDADRDTEVSEAFGDFESLMESLKSD